MTFRPDFGGERRHLIEAVFDRIGAHAIGYFGKLRQILGDLLRGDMGGQHQWRLAVAERRIGHAQQFGVGIDRRPRQVIGVASHHHTAAIAPRDISRSASGVRREISSILRAGIVD